MLIFHLQEKFFGCPIEFDSVLCWPATAPNSSSILPCFTEFLGINYDGSRKYILHHFYPTMNILSLYLIFAKVHSTDICDDDEMVMAKAICLSQFKHIESNINSK